MFGNRGIIRKVLIFLLVNRCIFDFVVFFVFYVCYYIVVDWGVSFEGDLVSGFDYVVDCVVILYIDIYSYN